MLFAKDLGFKTQSQNITADHVAVTNDSTTVFINGVTDVPGTIPDVVGMGAGDAVYLLEKKGLTTKMNGFGRVFRQSPTPGMPITKGETVSLELGFDALEIIKKDSLNAGDSIQSPVMAFLPQENKPVTEKPKINQNPAEKPKASLEAIKKWKEKVAAQKAKPNQPAKPNQAAIDRWKVKVAAQKALGKKKKTTKKNTVQPIKPLQ
jgi:beta-lactam-binding protein with PASTA domain